MKKRYVAALAAPVLLLAAAAAADNFQVRDGSGAMQTMASKLFGGVHYPIQILAGLFGSTPTPVAVDGGGNLGVNVQSAALPAGAATATNQIAVQAAPGAAATIAMAVQGTTGMTPVSTAGATPAFTTSGVTPVTGSLSATGQSSAYPQTAGRPTNIAFTGTGVFAIQLERKFSGDATWYPISSTAAQQFAWSTTGAGMVTVSATYTETENGVTLRWDVTACTSCSLTYRISQ